MISSDLKHTQYYWLRSQDSSPNDLLDLKDSLYDLFDLKHTQYKNFDLKDSSHPMICLI